MKAKSRCYVNLESLLGKSGEIISSSKINVLTAV